MDGELNFFYPIPLLQDSSIHFRDTVCTVMHCSTSPYKVLKLFFVSPPLQCIFISFQVSPDPVLWINPLKLGTHVGQVQTYLLPSPREPPDAFH